MAHKVENIEEVKDCVIITDEGIVALADSHKNLKAVSKSNEKKDDNERNSAVDKVNQYNMVTKENVDREKIDAWRNLKYMTTKQSIKHKLPVMSPPERARSKRICVRCEQDKQRPETFDIYTQTDPVTSTSGEDCERIQYIKQNDIPREAREENLLTEGKIGGREPEVHNLIEKYSEENKAKLSNFINSSNKKMSHPFTDTSITKNKNKVFEFIYNSLWQIVIFMSHHKEIIEKKGGTFKSCVDQSTQTSLDILKSKEDNNKSVQATSTKEITISQLSSDLPKVTECDILEQKMQLIHGNYQKLPVSETPRPPHPKDPRLRCQQNQQAQKQPQKQLINRPRFNSPETHEETAINNSKNTMQTNNCSSSRWQFGFPTHFGEEIRPEQQCRQWYQSNMARPQWFNMMPPPVLPPPQLYNQEPRFTNQPTSSMGQYQISSQLQDMAEYQKYQQMEMQKKAWESQLKNYPNSAWSKQLQEH